MRGQFFMADIFGAYAVFLIIMLLTLAFSVQLEDFVQRARIWDAYEERTIAVQDWFVYGNMTTRPYEFRKDRLDSFFAKPEAEFKEVLHLEDSNFSVSVIELDGGALLSKGGTITTPQTSVSLERFVRYDGKDCLLRVILWQG